MCDPDFFLPLKHYFVGDFGWDWDDVPEKLNLNLLTYLSEAAGVPRLLNYLLCSLVEDVKQLKHFNVPVLSPFPAERVDDFLNNFTSADEVLTKYDGKENDSVLRLKSPGLIMASICSLPVRLSDTFLVNNEPRSIENLENSGAVSCVPFIISPPSESRINSQGRYLDISAELPNYYTIAYPCPDIRHYIPAQLQQLCLEVKALCTDCCLDLLSGLELETLFYKLILLRYATVVYLNFTPNLWRLLGVHPLIWCPQLINPKIQAILDSQFDITLARDPSDNSSVVNPSEFFLYLFSQD
ncbi:hypothetical protein GEMRC1_005151 [Eukaryota sp. GEM-RC1]